MSEEELEVWPRARNNMNKCFNLLDNMANSDNHKL